MTTTSNAQRGVAVGELRLTGQARLAQMARLKRSRNRREKAIELVLLMAASVSVVTTVGIVYILLKESIAFFGTVSLWDFLTDTQWTPLFSDAHFGIMVLLSGTITS